MYRDSNKETYITLYKIDSQWELAVWLRELKPVLRNNLEGWDGEEDGARSKREETCISLADSC